MNNSPIVSSSTFSLLKKLVTGVAVLFVLVLAAGTIFALLRPVEFQLAIWSNIESPSPAAGYAFALALGAMTTGAAFLTWPLVQSHRDPTNGARRLISASITLVPTNRSGRARMFRTGETVHIKMGSAPLPATIRMGQDVAIGAPETLLLGIKHGKAADECGLARGAQFVLVEGDVVIGNGIVLASQASHI